MSPDTMPGTISGSSTAKNAREGVQPRSCAASESELSSVLKRGITDRMT